MINKFLYINYSRFYYDSNIILILNFKKFIQYIQLLNKFLFNLFPYIFYNISFHNLTNILIFKDNLKYDKNINIKNYKFLIFNFIQIFKNNLNNYIYHIFYLYNYKNQKIFFDFYNYINKIYDKYNYLNYFKYIKINIYKILIGNWFYNIISKKFNKDELINHKLKNILKFNYLFSFFNKYIKKKSYLHNKLIRILTLKRITLINNINFFQLNTYLKKTRKYAKFKLITLKRFKNFFGSFGLKSINNKIIFNNIKISGAFLLNSSFNKFEVYYLNNKPYYNLCLISAYL
jgi:hypothetical protein